MVDQISSRFRDRQSLKGRELDHVIPYCEDAREQGSATILSHHAVQRYRLYQCLLRG
jgi:hypothetical protein